MSSGFVSMDALLTLTGNRLDSRLLGVRRLGCLINWFMRLSQMACFVNLFSFPEEALGNKSRQDPFTMSAVANILIGELVVLLFALRRQRVKRLLANLTIGFDLIRVQRICITSWLILVIHVLTSLIITIDVLSSVLPWPLALLRIMISLPIYLNQFVIIYPAFYVSVMLLLTEHEVRHIQSIANMVTKGPASVIALIEERRLLMKMKRVFDDIFRFIPFVMFAMPFLTVPGYLSGIGKRASGQSEATKIIGYIAVHATIGLSIISMTATASWCKRQTDESANQLILCIYKRREREPRARLQALLEELMRDQAFAFTGCGVFRVEKETLLSFASALISMSVLVNQLLNGSH